MKRSTTLAIFFLLVTSQIFAAPQQVVEKRIIRRTPQTGVERPFLQFADKLELTDIQKEQLRAMNTEFAKKRIPLAASLKVARIELEEAIQKDEAKKDIDLKVKKVNDLRSQLYILNIDERFEFRKILTPEQKAKLKDLPETIPFGRGVRKPGMSPYQPMMDSCPSEMDECDEGPEMMEEEHE